MISQATNPSDAAPTLTTRPYLGVAGVLHGAMIATCTRRLMSVGLADIRGALHLGVDEASWINTSLRGTIGIASPATRLQPSDFRQFSPHGDVLCYMPGDRRIYVHRADAVSPDHCIER